MTMPLSASAIRAAEAKANDLPRAWFFGLLVIGACLLFALFVNERYSGEPIVPYELWRVRSVVLTNLGAFCIGIVLSCTTLFLPAYVQGVLGYGARVAGLVYAAQALAWSAASVLAARIMARTNFRVAAACGGVLLIAGALLMAMSPTMYSVTSGAIVVGIGMGLCNTTFIVACQAEIGWENRGMAIGAGIGGAVINFAIARAAPGAGDAVQVLLTPATRAQLPDAVIAELADAIGRALQDVYLTSAVAAALALGFGLALPAALSLTRAPERP